ncbi:transcription initiation factor TFIID subunit 1-like [Mercenaria mercenaria]|uniref:transcription initiation factor TFIID subunit 1-like n=1 Tax=Mercenaria mercenaria TaxID=6596 RepID=UPI00234EE0F7|nr:transcription initiation factor TFIID subunit 1-like [Mercenaria mercenaria]
MKRGNVAVSGSPKPAPNPDTLSVKTTTAVPVTSSPLVRPTATDSFTTPKGTSLMAGALGPLSPHSPHKILNQQIEECLEQLLALNQGMNRTDIASMIAALPKTPQSNERPNQAASLHTGPSTSSTWSRSRSPIKKEIVTPKISLTKNISHPEPVADKSSYSHESHSGSSDKNLGDRHVHEEPTKSSDCNVTDKHSTRHRPRSPKHQRSDSRHRSTRHRSSRSPSRHRSDDTKLQHQHPHSEKVDKTARSDDTKSGSKEKRLKDTKSGKRTPRSEDTKYKERSSRHQTSRHSNNKRSRSYDRSSSSESSRSSESSMSSERSSRSSSRSSRSGDRHSSGNHHSKANSNKRSRSRCTCIKCKETRHSDKYSSRAKESAYYDSRKTFSRHRSSRSSSTDRQQHFRPQRSKYGNRQYYYSSSEEDDYDYHKYVPKYQEKRGDTKKLPKNLRYDGKSCWL